VKIDHNFRPDTAATVAPEEPQPRPVEQAAAYKRGDDSHQLRTFASQNTNGGDPNSKHEEVLDTTQDRQAEQPSELDGEHEAAVIAGTREFMRQLATVFIDIYLASRESQAEQKAA
jgi:hypothetical protein